MVLTLPNVLTLLRILAVPFFAIAFWYGHMWEACALFIGAGLTDMLDGYLARRFNQRSTLGAILDPAADKLLMTAAFLLLAFAPGLHLGRVPAWVAILSVSRDVLISLVAVMSAGDFDLRRFNPSPLGKLTTAVELVAISLGLLLNVVPPRPWFRWLLPNAYYLVATLVLASGLHYFFRSANQVQERR
jgi:cardiolipin synthase (CMP-forming)